MFSQGAADVPCTLLHFMGGELVDVAKGRIVQPGNRMFHGNLMAPTVYRVELVRVLPGCDELLPPIRPAGADEDDVMTLSACVSWPLRWLKSQIRLGAADTTPQTRPPVVPQRYRTCRTSLWHRIRTCIWHRIRTTTTRTRVHLPTSISTLPNMGTVTNSSGLLLKNPTLKKTTAIELVPRRNPIATGVVWRSVLRTRLQLPPSPSLR